MRQTKLIILLMAVSASLSARTDPPGRVGRLNCNHGPVSFQPAGVNDGVEANINRPLTTGDQVWVGDSGRAEIHRGSTALRLDSNTAFQFLNLDDRTLQIQLPQGTLTVRARNLAPRQNLELDTPSLALPALHPGEYRIGAGPDCWSVEPNPQPPNAPQRLAPAPPQVRQAPVERPEPASRPPGAEGQAG